MLTTFFQFINLVNEAEHWTNANKFGHFHYLITNQNATITNTTVTQSIENLQELNKIKKKTNT